MDWLLAVLSLVALLSSARAQCATPLSITSYVVDRGAEVFQGNNTFDSSCTASGGFFNCLGSGGGSVPSVLVDGQTGGSALDISAVNAWSRDFYVAFTLVNMVDVIQADLYFYNIPLQRIGLPDIEVFWSAVQQFEPRSPLRHTILDNQDLSQDDNRLTRVTLRVATDFIDIPPFPFFRIQFRFSAETSIDWLLLSEVQLCEVQDPVPNNAITLTEGNEVLIFGPTEITSNHSLSCTVANEGLFQWQWTTPNNVPFEMQVANSRRTSIIQLTGITAMSGGYVGDFVCRAEYDGDALPTNTPAGSAMSRTITFDLRAILEPDDDVVQFTADDSFAVLVCEVFGYLIAAPDIEWRFRNAIVVSNDVYTITTRDGNNTMEVGGDIRPSLRSYLNISLVASSGIIGDYICLSNAVSDGVKTVTLQQASGVSPSSPTSQPPPVVGDGETDIGLIIGVVCGVLGAAVVVVFLVVVVCCCVRYRSSSKSGTMDFGSGIDNKRYADQPIYQELNKPSPPPIPNRFKQQASMHTGAYATIDNIGGNGHIELMEVNHQRISICSAPSVPDGNPIPVQLKHQPDFLQNNPLYASADHLDRSRGESLSNRRRMGSIPSLDVAESPRGSLLNIYAQPLRIAPPVPARPSTPTLLDGPIYSEAALNPAVFRQQQMQRATQSPPDDEVHPYASIYDDPRPLLKSEGPLEVHASNVKRLRKLGTGQFGQVILAETAGLSLKDLKMSDSNDDKNITVLVAMKTLKPDADKGIKEAFEKEIKFMTRLCDNNVVRLLAICSSANPFILMEYMENGDLNQYLQKYEEAPLDGSPIDNSHLRPSALLYMSVQIASGMKYLAKQHFVHRDLATRNCLVGKDNEVKIADFGMSRSLYSSYYYRIRGRAMLPIRWMSNECFYGKFSEKTDVWAFGVSMWEIFTFAKKQPYEGMTDQQVIDDAVKDSERTILGRPDYCPQEIYEVMTRCWVADKDERANFEEIHSSLSALHDYSDIP